MSTIVTGDGQEAGLAIAALLVACTVLPVAAVWAWHLFQRIVWGDSSDDDEGAY